jgi:hypothetical protein
MKLAYKAYYINYLRCFLLLGSEKNVIYKKLPMSLIALQSHPTNSINDRTNIKQFCQILPPLAIAVLPVLPANLTEIVLPTTLQLTHAPLNQTKSHGMQIFSQHVTFDGSMVSWHILYALWLPLFLPTIWSGGATVTATFKM